MKVRLVSYIQRGRGKSGGGGGGGTMQTAATALDNPDSTCFHTVTHLSLEGTSIYSSGCCDTDGTKAQDKTFGTRRADSLLMQTVKVCRFSNNWGNSGSLYT